MTGRAQPEYEVRSILRAIARQSRPLVLLSVVVWAGAAVVLALLPRQFQGTMVLVPVEGQRASGGLASAASLLGGALDLGSNGFDATRDVVAYLLHSRTVLLAAAATPYAGRPLSVPMVDKDARSSDEEMLLSALRRALRVTTAKETGFVTVVAKARDSGAVRAFFGAVVGQTQRLFAEVAQSQARQLLRAQERRLDSAEVELRRAEDRLLGFDESNRLVTPRTRLSLTRARLERDVSDAARVYDQVVADRQGAIARELEEAPAIAVVEDLPAPLPPKPRRILFRSLLLGLATFVVGLLFLVTRELARSSAAFESQGA